MKQKQRPDIVFSVNQLLKKKKKEKFHDTTIFKIYIW